VKGKREKKLSFVFIDFSESGLFNALRAIQIRNFQGIQLASQVVIGARVAASSLLATGPKAALWL
jgi:hypothetical protein